MSKSLGNFTSLDDLLARSDPRAYRLLVLRAHYRSPIEVTPETVGQAEAGLARLDELARRFGLADPLAGGHPVTSVAGSGNDDLDQTAVARFVERMDDDLDTPGALSGVFELVREANVAADAGRGADAGRAARTVAHLAAVLGLQLRGERKAVDDPEVLDLVSQRDAARTERRFADADALRDQLVGRGWVVEDGPGGTRVRRP